MAILSTGIIIHTGEFVQPCHREKDALLKDDFEAGSQTVVGEKLRAMEFSDSQRERLCGILNDALTDAFYTLLPGLDGSTSIGGVQKINMLYDKSGVLILDCGELEAAAYEYFQDA